MMGTELTVINRVQGQQLVISDAPTEDLARFMGDLQTVRDSLREEEQLVNDELLQRLDKDACWTCRVGDPTDIQWELKAPSPAAGTESYLVDVLETELRQLVERGTISVEGAGKALKRTVTITLSEIPLDVDLKQLADDAQNLQIEVAGVPVRIGSADANRSAVKAGINALRKIQGTGAALDRAQVTQSPGARRVKVTVKTRAVL